MKKAIEIASVVIVCAFGLFAIFMGVKHYRKAVANAINSN